MKKSISLFILSALLFSEHPTTIKEPKLTVAELAISIENYI